MGNLLFSRYIFFPPEPRTITEHMRLGEGYDPTPVFYTVPFDDDDGSSSTLKGSIFVAEVKPKKMRPGGAPIIWSYGNGCDVYSMLSAAHRAAMYLQTAVYLYDYPGYGLSCSGMVPSEAGCITALCNVMRDVIARNKLGSAGGLVLVGQSLGTAVTIGAIHRESMPTPKQVVLISPFTSVPDVANVGDLVQAGYRMIGGDTFATGEKIGAVRAPIKIYHGKEDALIPYEHSVELQKLNPKARLVLVPYADHNNILSKIDLSELLS